MRSPARQTSPWLFSWAILLSCHGRKHHHHHYHDDMSPSTKSALVENSDASLFSGGPARPVAPIRPSRPSNEEIGFYNCETCGSSGVCLTNFCEKNVCEVSTVKSALQGNGWQVTLETPCTQGQEYKCVTDEFNKRLDCEVVMRRVFLASTLHFDFSHFPSFFSSPPSGLPLPLELTPGSLTPVQLCPNIQYAVLHIFPTFLASNMRYCVGSFRHSSLHIRSLLPRRRHLLHHRLQQPRCLLHHHLLQVSLKRVRHQLHHKRTKETRKKPSRKESARI